MKPFDLNTAPLTGVTLIEAGAGTGKTYTLAGIFLRLIVERGLGIDQILVVTYTKAATEELKTRIRQRLLTAKAAFGGKTVQDDFLAHMVSQIRESAPALQRIKDALTDFDRAAIFTIHGFCQRLLQHFAFETGQLFQSELVQEQQPLIQEAADDFWRRYISSAPYELAHYALENLKGPEQMAAVLDFCRYPDLTVVPPPVKPPLSAIAPWRRAADRLGQMWALEKEKILNLLLDPGLNARYYGKCEPDPQMPDLTQRRIRLMQLAGSMDFWNGKYPICSDAERFTSSFLKKATKKNHHPPRHPFFDLCQEAVQTHGCMVRQLADYLRYLKIRLHGQARPRLDEKKIRKSILFFDDLLLHVYDALAGAQGQQLVGAVSAQYKAALVDEFQDTDPIQYKIFQHLFGKAADLLVMIGDPKQAIYSFRGADIFSYLRAAESARTNTTLTKNWRSTPTLVQAVNTIFESHAQPFGFEKIKYNRAIAANAEPLNGNGPLTIWFLPGKGEDGSNKPISQEAAVSAIAEAVSEEIVRLICDPAAHTAPGQIAVLARTHKQSQVIKKALSHKKVPAVLHSAGSVFDTSEAEAVARVMAAAAAPNDPAAVRAALASDLLGVQAREFHEGLGNPTEKWQARWNAFVRDHRTWVRHGFYRMFRGVLVREGVKGRLLAQPEGERRLTNLLHLAELLHQAESDHHLGAEGLIKWLAAQRQAPQKGSDGQQLRLESDALAVRIITMHKSKGLQFDVVFCPFVWSGVGADKNAAVFHDPRRDDRLTLAMGPDIAPDHQLQARKEALAENLRMMYVALTRARQRCYMVWGRINNTEVSAPAYLFHTPGMAVGLDDWITPLVQKVRGLDDAGMLGELQALARRSGGSVVIEALPQSTGVRYEADETPLPLWDSRLMKRTVTAGWRIASFSSLTAGQPDEDRLWPDRDLAVLPSPPTVSGSQPFSDLFGFPKGVRAGLFFHDVLEHWDHGADDQAKCSTLVSTKLMAHGFDLQWAPVVNEMLANLAATVLNSHGESFTLGQVPPPGRINEMEFYFPLQAFNLKTLNSLFERFGQRVIADRAGERLGRLTIAPIQGYMKGYIDAVFCFNGRYYLVDWKSNYLGAAYADYAAKELAAAVAADYYFLQYNLYVLALDQLLRQKLEDYDYTRHFGGVFYIFLRGISPDRSGATGLFYDRPDPRLVSGLGELLIGGRGIHA